MIMGFLFSSELRTRKKWENLFVQSTREIPDYLPPIRSKYEREHILCLWWEYRVQAGGDSAKFLNTVAIKLSLDYYCLELLNRGSISNPHIAIDSLGFMGVKKAYDSIQKRVDQRDPDLSFASAKALTQIDAERAFIWLLPVMAKRLDWTHDRLSILFQEAGPALLAKYLPRYVLDNDETDSARLVPFLRCLPNERRVLVATRILESSRIDAIKTECLSLLKPCLSR